MTTHIPSLTLPAFVFEQPAVAVLLPVVLGTGVGFSTQPKKSQDSHMELKQPPFRPPPYIFGPMWTTLYACMGYAAHRAWTTGMRSMNPRTIELTKHGATLFTVQMGLNLLWMPLFFRFHRPIEATIDIVALTGVAGYMTSIWSQVDEVAGYFLAPYVGWLAFATYLSAGAGYLNGWNFQDKQSSTPPSSGSGDTKYINEKDE